MFWGTLVKEFVTLHSQKRDFKNYLNIPQYFKVFGIVYFQNYSQLNVIM